MCIRSVIFLFLCSLALGGKLYAQATSPLSISGYISTAEAGERLIGAALFIPGLQVGTYSNEFGYYSVRIPVPQDSLELRFSFLGYETVVKRVLPKENLRLDIQLGEQATTLEAVEITADSYQDQLKSTEMGVSRISIAEAKVLPAFLGEVDIIKTLQLKPGVSSGSEGSSGIFVRGGGADQNLILLDGTLLYNPSHLFGLFSTFNSDAVKDVKLYKAGFPAQYAGRLSSVIDVRMKEGNEKEWAVSGGLGLISSRLTVEGPLKKDKGAFLLSGRRTYVDLFTRLINNANEDNADFNPIPNYAFYDLNAKSHYKISARDELSFSGYLGQDRFEFNDGDFDFLFDWGNRSASLNWNHLFSPNLFMNVGVSTSDYQYSIKNQLSIFSFELNSQITDYGAHADFSWVPNNKHYLRWGVQAISHRYIVGRLNAGSQDSSFNFTSGQTFYGTEAGAYISDDWEPNKKIKVHLGLRLSGFFQDGTNYGNVEPRVSFRWQNSSKTSFKASYARMSQYSHLVSGSGATLPTDVWFPTTDQVRPEFSDQVSTGFSWVFGNGKYLLSNEVYYKWLDNQIDFRNGAELFVNEDLESEFVFGRGWAYGNEFYIEKTKGRLTGWIGYTLAWSWRKFDGSIGNEGIVVEDIINEGERFHPRNDQRHDVSIVASYKLNKRLTVSATWEYRTGNAVSLPTGRFTLTGNERDIPRVVPIYEGRNAFRMPAYHRMDLSVVWKFFPKWGSSDLTFSIYNAYNRRNAYFLYIDTVTDANDVPVGFEAKQVALFPMIPSITYNFRF